ncbi:MAG: aminopeptidase [Anaerolineales bacterium]|nr:MAG: aminopeptidase [Anaerolineales bacterium]
MDKQFQENLKKYAELTVKVGLNLQPGQKLIMHHLRNGGVPIQTAPLIRELTVQAYQAGSPLVDVQWRDDELTFARIDHAPKGSFDEFPTWHSKAILDVIDDGGAILTISAYDPDLMAGRDPEVLDQMQRAFLDNWEPVSAHIDINTMNWSLISIPVEGWARKVFPDLPAEEQMPALWDAIFKICRVYEVDPLAAWESHLAGLKVHGDYLNKKAYQKLHYTAPGTDLWITLPKDHVWRSAGFKAQSGINFTANIPTEEVFTLPDRRFTEGTVRSARPLVYAGNVIDNFNLTFKEGKVAEFRAEQGENILEKLLRTDDGASMLGEVALVPNSSPISQSGLLFYNTLLDENASCHLALGRAYRFSLDGGEKLSVEDFGTRGGNTSLVHSDFMIGSGEMDIDGVLENGEVEPVLRAGEWAF